MRSVATLLTSAVALAPGLFGAVKAPPPFGDPENRARHEAARAAMALFGTDAFPVNGLSLDQGCAAINAAAGKHMFVGISAPKKPGMTEEQLAAIFSARPKRAA
jgi:hypothetical protein